VARRPVPLPPMPTDPAVCRWCEGRIRDGRCLKGCRPADQPTYREWCTDCDREFDTGDPWHGYVCWQCQRPEIAAAIHDVTRTVAIECEFDQQAIDRRDRARERARGYLWLF
jgi:hypothetical protein